jgi:hypothetical protein
MEPSILRRTGWLRTVAVCAPLIAALLALAYFSCAPETRYRREALVPGPHPPPYRGEALGRGKVEIQGQIAGSHVVEQVPEIGDPALWIPDFHLNVSALFGVTGFLDLGLVAMYAHGSWARASAVGTPPMPEGGDHLFSLGPQIGMGFKAMDERIFGGGYLSVQYARLPWSAWERGVSGTYTLAEQGADHEAYFKLGLYFGGRPVPWLALNMGLLLTSAWLNEGFSDEYEEGSTLRQVMPHFMPLLGARFDVEPVFFELFVTFPIVTEREIDIFPVGWNFGFGVRI